MAKIGFTLVMLACFILGALLTLCIYEIATQKPWLLLGIPGGWIAGYAIWWIGDKFKLWDI